MLRLPKRELPSEVDEQCVVAIADGPSCDEYDMQEIFSSGATTVGYGMAWRQGKLDYYCPFHHELLKDMLDHVEYSTCMLVHRDRYEIFKHLGLVQEPHRWETWGGTGLFGSAANVAKKLRKYNMYVLGEDGYFHLDGLARRKIHTNEREISDPEIATKIENLMQAPKYWLNAHTCTQNRIAQCWNGKRMNPTLRVYSLSVHGWPSLLLQVPDSVLAQPFAWVDRNASAVIFDITKANTPEFKHAEPHQSFGEHVLLIRRLRARMPTLAIFVRSYTKVPVLKSFLEQNAVLVGEQDEEINTCNFSHVRSFRLPGILE